MIHQAKSTPRLSLNSHGSTVHLFHSDKETSAVLFTVLQLSRGPGMNDFKVKHHIC